ncbi:O-methyltransferase [Fusarium sp. NRRL 25303]|nr:O-methyltransferase [Fusarium sp. NRRL 25303]
MEGLETIHAEPKINVKLGGVQQTLLATLVFRALDYESKEPLLGDEFASQTLSQIQGGDELLSQARGTLLDHVSGLLPAMRAKLFDTWTTQFCQRNQGATILHLGCGLDARSLRVSWKGKDRLWVDLDVPEVARIRQKVMKPPQTENGAQYRIEAKSVTDDGWLIDLPTDRPALVIMEGLLVYLAEDEVHGLLGAILQHFQKGEIIFDATGSLLAWCFGKMASRYSKEPIPMKWPLDDARVLPQRFGELKLETVLTIPELDGFSRLPFALKALLRIGQRAGVAGRFGSFVRYTF